MARLTGSKNKNNNSLNITKMFQEHWSSPDKLEAMNKKLLSIIEEAGSRDALSAIIQIQKYIMITADKQLESETAIETSMSKEDILKAIKTVKGE